MSPAIDAHVHVWPGEGSRKPFTAEDLFTYTEPAGVKQIVLIQPGFYKFDNSYMLDTMKAHPGVFSAVAIVDSAGLAPATAMSDLARRGARGFRIVPGAVSKTWLDTPGMHAMWAAGAKQRLVMCPLINPDALPSINRMCTRFPDTTVVIDHLARIGADGQIRDSDIRLLCGLSKHKNVNVKVSAFYALGNKQPPYTDLTSLIRRVFEDYGPRRLMWATDSPYQVQSPHTYQASLALIQDRLPFLSNEDKEWILSKTAERIFFGG